MRHNTRLRHTQKISSMLVSPLFSPLHSVTLDDSRRLRRVKRTLPLPERGRIALEGGY